MKKISALAALITCALNSFSQSESATNKITTPIIKEARILYQQEMASWYGTDVFLENYKKKENIGGYFSYLENDSAKCVFFSKAEYPIVIGTITFDQSYDLNKAKRNFDERAFSKKETDFYAIRNTAVKATQTDTTFKFYKNANFNFVPIINDLEKKVYVLTGPKENGLVIFGNDYLLKFDKDNNLQNIKRLHKNIIFNKYTGDENEVGSMHTHLKETGDFPTATDLCTLMLYGKFTKWKTYNVLSPNYFSIWDIKKNDLTVITREALERITKDQAESHPIKKDQ